MPFLPTGNSITIPELDEIPGLVHGFGTKALTEEVFRKSLSQRNLEEVFLKQVHSDTVLPIVEIPDRPPVGDALVTGKAGIVLGIRTADCLPVFLVDPANRLAGAVHCGWRGTTQRIVQKTVKVMSEMSGTRSSILMAGLGPAIGADCYEVGEDVREKFWEAGLSMVPFKPSDSVTGKYLFDLREANRLQLVQAGLSREKIFSVRTCTHCDPGLFSYRRDRETRHRLINIIGWTI